MMVRPWPPMTFTCQACGWRVTTLGSSDAMRLGVDIFDCCAKRMSAELDRREATPSEVRRERWRRSIKWR